ncbi:MAG: hypothetical protein A3D35_03285 [Candidatus Staskawiczbacteria bacterium RIFCSPHIGHO2_02_FULL_34_9]|uniref:RNA polymerase sigma factor n=1 Tax=Candidatus Staskawiczbacteria bacterium RIFCSPHIGHO2_02_FULL_34_9 TaxID=1802206 RepID=A0A1G2I2Z8_9BACT|nr:MAG: hypothetical protein A3D35_03285 [Candidatus Staskawiczbacteria bacterium RIFCSPHIGHO2_02_FULL_34_9]
MNTAFVLSGIDFVLIILYTIMDNLKEQFGQIYDQYIEKIYRFVYLKVNSQEVAEDITSKVFLNGWQSYSKNPSVQNMNAFLYRIARNSVIDYYRESDRTKLVSLESVAEFADAGTSVHDRAALSSDLEEVKFAIGKLKKDHQDVIILHYLEDMSIQEISEVLDKSLVSVRVTLHRGLKALKEQMIQEV